MVCKMYTIGFTQKSAEAFFGLLQKAGVERIIDVRLNNSSQLAGFAKARDLKYFAKAICGCDYIHAPLLAPTKELLDGFKKGDMDWNGYEHIFSQLMQDRGVTTLFSREQLHKSCFLCSEALPVQCHRRLVAEYYSQALSDIQVIHL